MRSRVHDVPEARRSAGASGRSRTKAARFLPELESAFDDFPRSEHPRDRRFAEVLEAVPGLARENNLALLNVAASLLESGESYVEVGTFKGTSLIAAMLGNDGDFVGIDNFSFGDGTREELAANLERFGCTRAEILEGDAFELLRGGVLADRQVAVYYYDNGHAYEQQLDGLRLVEPHLTSPALMIVDDTDWERVARATTDYLKEQPRVRLLLEIVGNDRGQPWWWEGVHVLLWDGPPASLR
jgi:predicted O-methyltransferase YrrM